MVHITLVHVALNDYNESGKQNYACAKLNGWSEWVVQCRVQICTGS